MKDYIIEYSHEINDEHLESLIRSMPGMPLSQLKIKDLVFYQEKPIHSGNGVYVFKRGEEICYVGNCIARNFVERIPAHFDIRAGGWFHSLLVALIKKKYGKVPKTNEKLQEAAEIAFTELSLILINFPNDIYNRISINNLENRLGNRLKPYNNRFKKIIMENIIL